MEIYQTSYCPSDPPRPSGVVTEDGLCGQYSIERLGFFLHVTFSVLIHKRESHQLALPHTRRSAEPPITLEITDLGISQSLC